MTTTRSSDLDFKYPFILNGTYFKIISEEGRNITAECKKCPTGSKHNGTLDATSNFLKHLKRVHNDELSKYEVEMQEFSKKRRIWKKTQPKDVSQPPITDAFPRNMKSSVSKNEKLLMNFVVKGMHPLSTVEEEAFQALLNGYDQSKPVISRRTLTRKLEDHYTESREKISDAIMNVKHLCITADAWTCDGKKRAFFGLTAHWILADLKRESVVLACRRFKGSHTYDTIAELIVRVLREYRIPMSKVVKGITDSGSNFLKAFREFANDDQSSEQLDLEDDENEDEHCIPLHLEEILNNVENQPKEYLPPHHPCSSHMLNLICAADLTKAVVPSVHRAALSKAQGIWNKISRSTQTAEKIKEICNSSIVTPVCTRWNTLFDSLVCLIKYEDKLDDICKCAKVKEFRASEVEHIKEYIQCVKPIALGLDRLQGENNTYYGELIPTLLTIEKQLLREEIKPIYWPTLPKLLLSSFRKRFSSFLDLSGNLNTDAIIASIAHPFFKLRWIPEDKIAELKKLFIATVIKENNQNDRGSHIATQSELNENQKEDTLGEEGDFFQFGAFDAVQNNTDESFEHRVEKECETYFRTNVGELQMLHNFPFLKSIFIKFNTPLPSSAPVERLFNYAKLVLSPNRRTLTDDNFEMLTLLKVNKF